MTKENFCVYYEPHGCEGDSLVLFLVNRSAKYYAKIYCNIQKEEHISKIKTIT